MKPAPNNNKARQIGFYLLILVILLGTIYTMTSDKQNGDELIYSEVVELFRNEQVESFTLDTDGNLMMKLREEYKGHDTYNYAVGMFSIFYTDLNDLIQEQKAAGILTEYDYPPAWQAPWWMSFLPYLLIMLIMGGLWFVMMNRAQGGGGGGIAKFS